MFMGGIVYVLGNMGVELWELWCNFMGWCSSMRDLGVVIWGTV